MNWDSVPIWIEAHPGMASWVQAVGSILAILAAIWIARRDSRARRVTEEDARRSALWRAHTAVDDTVRRVGSAVETVQAGLINQHTMDMINSDLRQAEQHLKEAMSADGLTPEIYAELFTARTSVEDVSFAVNLFYKSPDAIPELLDSVRSAVNQVMESRATLKKMQGETS